MCLIIAAWNLRASNVVESIPIKNKTEQHAIQKGIHKKRI